MASAMAGMEALTGVYDGLKTRMAKSVDDFRANLASVRTGRASVHMLDGIKVEYYGTETPLNELAQIKTPEASLIVVEPFDPSIVAAVEKAIRTSPTASTPCTTARSSASPSRP